MKDLINGILKNPVNKYFEFELSVSNSVKNLKKATKLVPNLSGIYLVFSEGLSESNHLNFKISDKNYSLLYFGKAGGITNSGRVIIQGLNSRINNVVSDSTRGLKDVKRAKYWNELMLEFGIEKLYVFCNIHDNPQQLENIIYGYLDNNNLEYPLMNKKRGRLSKKNKSEILKKNDNVSVSTKISKQIKKTKNLISKPIKLQNSNSKESVYGSCVEFQLARNQNIATIANGISNLHVGPCSIELFYKNSNDVRLYINNGKRNIRTKNRTISEYFNSPDTKNGNIPKWQIVQNEMNEPNRKIEEITVRVCSNGNEKYINSKFELNSKQSKQLKQNKLVNVSIDENLIPANTSSILNKNIYLIPCSSKKIQLEKMENKKFNIEKLEFNNELGKYRKIILKKLNNTKSHKRKKNGITNSIINNLNLNITAQANVLYSEGRLYNSKSSESINWNKNKKEKIYIISALFGIIRADNYIPKYDLAMTDEIDNKKNYAQKFWKGKMDEIIKNLIEDGNTVYNLLSKNYCDIFNSEIISLTKIPKIEYNKSDANGKRGKWLKNNL
jgi:cytoplasmic iron level regulating protein YaaA (DUF328/UPF0246 family)